MEDAKIYRLRAEYRRCGIYAVIGAILCVALASAVASLVRQGGRQGRSPEEMIVVMSLFVVAAAVLCAILWNWRLQVGQEGISRRFLGRWNTWPWDAFRSETIRQGRGFGEYRWPEAAWGWRTLRLELLEDDDVKDVNALIKRLWARPPEEPLPEEVRFRVNFTRVQLLADGLSVRRGRNQRHCDWKDVDRVIITRLDHDRRDFARLKIEWADKPIELFLNQGRPVWRGAEAEVIARWFTTYAPAERVLTVALKEPPRSAAEAEYRLATLRKDGRKFRTAKRWVVILSLALVSLGIFGLKYLCMGACYLPLCFAYWRLFNDRRKTSEKEEQELLDWLDSPRNRPIETPVA